jgi:hypothetical protein
MFLLSHASYSRAFIFLILIEVSILIENKVVHIEVEVELLQMRSADEALEGDRTIINLDKGGV